MLQPFETHEPSRPADRYRAADSGEPAMTATTIRPAVLSDLPALVTLLGQTELPMVGVADHLETFLVADGPAGVVASAGLELYGGHALLRSVAVAPGLQGTGLGRTMIEAALDLARVRGAETITLLTTTAAGYFSRFGFGRIDQAGAPSAVRQSTQFNGICPASAVAMQLILTQKQAAS